MTAILFGSISTLVDSSELQRQAFNHAFAQHGLDWEWDRETYRSMLDSNGGAARVADYAARRGEQVDADAVHATKSSIFRASLRGAAPAPRPGVVEVIRSAREDGMKVALVTTTSAENVDAVVAALAPELTATDFDTIIDLTDEVASKPRPDAYELALERLGESADACVAIEDNPGGVAAAAAAGVTVAAFPNANTAGQAFPGAAATVRRLDLTELTGLASATG